eukprot:PhF_6_TR36207/c0_g1_i2/m.52832
MLSRALLVATFIAIITLFCTKTEAAPTPTPTTTNSNSSCFFSDYNQSIVNKTNSTTKPMVAARIEANWKTWVTLAICILLLIILVFDLMPVAAAFFGISLLFQLIGIISAEEFVSGLANPGTVSIALLFPIVDSLTQLPIVHYGIQKIMSGDGYKWPLFKIMVATMSISWFILNLPLVAMLTTLIRQYCQEKNLSPSQLLMPMNFGTLLGGMFSMIGNSTNLVYDGLMAANGLSRIPFFEPVKVAAVPAVVALVYCVFMPQYLLPFHKGGMYSLVEDKNKGEENGAERNTYIMQVEVMAHSSFEGSVVSSLSLPMAGSKLQILSARRGDDIIDHTTTAVVAGDVLDVKGTVTEIQSASKTHGLRIVPASTTVSMRTLDPSSFHPTNRSFCIDGIPSMVDHHLVNEPTTV